MWRQRVETSERGWANRPRARNRPVRTVLQELLPQRAPINMQGTDRVCRPQRRRPPLDLLSQYHIPRLITCSRLCARGILPIFVQCRPSTDQDCACLAGRGASKILEWGGGPTMRIRSCQTCLGSKAYAYPASRSGRRAGHETKQTRSRGGRATDSGAPSTCLPSCGPAANCGAAVGTRHEAHKFPRRCCPHRVGTRCCWLQANATSLQPPA